MESLFALVAFIYIYIYACPWYTNTGHVYILDEWKTRDVHSQKICNIYMGQEAGVDCIPAKNLDIHISLTLWDALSQFHSHCVLGSIE